MPDMLRVLKSLSDRTRLRIVRLLLHRDLCVCELLFILDMAQSRVSHQLRILRDAGLVEDTRDGQWIIYRIPPDVRATIAPLFRLFRENAADTKEEANDKTMLEACLREGLRKKKCGGAESASRSAGARIDRAAENQVRRSDRGE